MKIIIFLFKWLTFFLIAKAVEKTADTDYSKLPEQQHQTVEDSNSNGKSIPPEEQRVEEQSTLIPSTDPGDTASLTGEKHEDIPIKKTPPLLLNAIKPKDDGPIKMMQSEASKMAFDL